MNRITFGSVGDALNFGVGDIINTDEIVSSVAGIHITTRPNTRFWRTWVWMKRAPRRAWRWVRNVAWSAWDAITHAFEHGGSL
jgi:hypothetical protein